MVGVLADRDAPERARSGVLEGVGQPALPASYEIARLDRPAFRADAGRRFAFQDVPAFFFVIEDVVFGAFVARGHLDDAEIDRP